MLNIYEKIKVALFMLGTCLLVLLVVIPDLYHELHTMIYFALLIIAVSCLIIEIIEDKELGKSLKDFFFEDDEEEYVREDKFDLDEWLKKYEKFKATYLIQYRLLIYKGEFVSSNEMIELLDGWIEDLNNPKYIYDTSEVDERIAFIESCVTEVRLLMWQKTMVEVINSFKMSKTGFKRFRLVERETDKFWINDEEEEEEEEEEA